MSLFNDFEALPTSCCLSLGCIARYAPFGSTLCLLGASALPLAPLSKATGFLHAQQSVRQSIQNCKK